MPKQKLKFCTRLAREDVAGLIEALVEGLKDGILKVQKSGETLELNVPRVVDLEVEAEVDDERAEFEIEVSWRTNRAENPDVAPDTDDQPCKCAVDPEVAKASLEGAAASGEGKKTAPAGKKSSAGKSKKALTRVAAGSGG